MLVQMVGAHRLKKCGVSYVRTLHDCTNAFSSTTHEALQTYADANLLEQDKQFFDTRRVNSQIFLGTAGGEELVVVPGCGALMGDSNAPTEFAMCFEEEVVGWDKDLQHLWGNNYLKATLPGVADSVDLGRTTYADDVARLHPVRGPREAVAFISMSNRRLSVRMSEGARPEPAEASDPGVLQAEGPKLGIRIGKGWQGSGYHHR